MEKTTNRRTAISDWDKKNHLFIQGEKYDLSGLDSTYLKAVITSWNNLPEDFYLKRKQLDGLAAKDYTRKRRFGKFQTLADSENIDILPFNDLNAQKYKFVQSQNINVLHGGETRFFDAITPVIHQFIFLIIRNNIRLISELIGNQQLGWNIDVHQIRIEAIQGAIGLPAPEGIHCDGHDFLSIHLINSRYLSGATSRLYDKNLKEIAQYKLGSFMDTILLNDRKLFHSVDAMQSFINDEISYRDVLIIDYNQTIDT